MDQKNYTAALARLREAKVAIAKDDKIRRTVEARDEVLARFQPLLRADEIPHLPEDAIRPFFYFEHNKHWSGLYRQVNRICGDMAKLREVLGILMDEKRPIEHRLDKVSGQIKGLGKGILTALLQVAFPDKYGVWNNTSEEGLIAVGLMPEFPRGLSFGSRYSMLNEIFLRLSADLDTDLWTLDVLWWLIRPDHSDNAGEPPVAGEPESDEEAAVRFALERHLHYFLFDNWNATVLGRNWDIYTRPGEPDAGFEFICGIGRIDILARHKTEPKWLVVELKRGKSSDTVVGQVTRYMGWVKAHLAEANERVEGLIVALDAEPALHYAVAAVPGLSFMSYRVDFQLLEAPAPKSGSKP